MKKKEYPATHSMWTAWFAIDTDGNVAIMECDDNGPAPVSVKEEQESDTLILESITDCKSKIKYTDEQLLLLMRNSISAEEYIANFDADNYQALCEIDPAKLSVLKEAASIYGGNELKCISEKLNLWYVSFSLPHYIGDSEISRNKVAKNKIDENNRAKSLYEKILKERVVLRIVILEWELGYNQENIQPKGFMRKEDSPFTLYFQEYNSREPSERMYMHSDDLSVKEYQLPKSIIRDAIRLPLSFKNHNRIQIAQYIASRFYETNCDWKVDGNPSHIAKLPDDKYYFVGNGCFFPPLPLDEAFENHDTRFTPYSREYVHEYKINGKRGYLRILDGPFRRVGSEEIYVPKETDIIERIEN